MILVDDNRNNNIYTVYYDGWMDGWMDDGYIIYMLYMLNGYLFTAIH
jgi:hypothetical protein